MNIFSEMLMSCFIYYCIIYSSVDLVLYTRSSPFSFPSRTASASVIEPCITSWMSSMSVPRSLDDSSTSATRDRYCRARAGNRRKVATGICMNCCRSTRRPGFRDCCSPDGRSAFPFCNSGRTRCGGKDDRLLRLRRLC